jgi:fructokinase
MPIWGGVEAGGDKFVCAIGTGPGDLKAEDQFDTTTPEETLSKVINFFNTNHKEKGSLKAIGIGSFGPIDINPNSATFGNITSTPKPGWAHTDFVGFVKRNLGVPVKFDTDVNAAAFGERRWGAAKGLDDFIYLTVGTGIGGGGMVDGELLHGLVHPEMGHIRIPHNKINDDFPGCCPFHGDCWEGLAAGPAIEKRWGTPGHKLPADHPAWELEAHYLALGLINIICTLSPQRIIMGGGVMQQRQLFPMIRESVIKLLSGYIRVSAIIKEIDSYIVPPALGNKAGVLGAIALAQQTSD